MGRGKPEGGKKWEIRLECAIAAGRWVRRQTRCLVSVLTKTGINSIKKGQFILTNICTTSSHADLQMRRSLNVRVSQAQGAFVRDGR